ncbi:hypothetical protein [Saccharomonospora glauca]|uniref:Excreted virulence factor EspC (Type VII ESX diderm) n=1 Tax=Saccharomonospora glauca K62 TaxID=928724 RepID=I1D5L0_9PSEU|nr:hypothetical protein [Saccharomonospora glauca]EIF00235.1 Protein of unknown function (DUF2580) [Saccharomonospora glauca K62]
MAPPDIRMNPPGVHNTAERLADIAETAKTNISSLFASSDAAATAHPGWRTSSALAACTDTWRTELVTVIERTTDVAGKLHTSATEVTEADAEARERLTAAVSGLQTND